MNNKKYKKKRFSKKQNGGMISSNKITIDIGIPIYLPKISIRYYITEKIFKYMIYLKKKLVKHNILLSFTIIGCNTNLSKNLYHKYFNSPNDVYIPFDQNVFGEYYGAVSPFRDMITDKITKLIREVFLKTQTYFL